MIFEKIDIAIVFLRDVLSLSGLAAVILYSLSILDVFLRPLFLLLDLLDQLTYNLGGALLVARINCNYSRIALVLFIYRWVVPCEFVYT